MPLYDKQTAVAKAMAQQRARYQAAEADNKELMILLADLVRLNRRNGWYGPQVIDAERALVKKDFIATGPDT